MVLRHHIDTPCHILHGSIGCESCSLLHQLLCLFGRHAVGQFYQHVGAAAGRLLNEQQRQWRMLQESLANLIGMAFFIEVHHQSVKRLDGIGYGAVIVAILGTAGRPHWQAMLQLIITFLYALAHLLKPLLSAHHIPSFSGGRVAGGAVSPANACKVNGADYC
jgi:hypothetical protein